MGKNPETLYICRGNVGRSQMAQAFHNSLSGSGAISAGLDVAEQKEGEGLAKEVYECMQEEGYSMEGHYRKQVTLKMIQQADKVVVITSPADFEKYAELAKQVLYWDIPDAKGTDLEYHRLVRDSVESHVRELLGHD